jgi:hypothetical protein
LRSLGLPVPGWEVGRDEFSEVAAGAGQPGMPMGQRVRTARKAAKMSPRELAG